MFTGFSPEALPLLTEIRERNSKLWFEAHRARYEELLLTPFRELVSDLSALMLEIDEELDVTPNIGRTLSRIYRDTRFSKDKSLFRDRIWLTFKRPVQDWQGNPAWFFELGPDFYRYGMGYYHASRETMATLRAYIDENKDFLKMARDLAGHGRFSVEGEKYKRQPSHLAPEAAEWYGRKEIYISCNNYPDEILYSAQLRDNIIRDFQLLIPAYLVMKMAAEKSGKPQT